MLIRLAAALLAPLLAAQAPILVANLGSEPQSQWVFCGLPPGEDIPLAQGYLEDVDAGTRYLYVRGDRCVRVDLRDVKPGRHKLTFTKAGAKTVFSIAPGLDLARLIPRWHLNNVWSDVSPYWPLGGQKPGDSFVRLEEWDTAHQLWHVRQRHPDQRMTHDMWATVYSGQLMVEWVSQSVYGTTANDGQPQELTLPGRLNLISVGDVPIWRDFGRVDGVSQAQRIAPQGHWPIAIMEPGEKLHRGRRLQIRGAMHPTATRAAGMPPLTALYTGWAGKWFNGPTPQVPTNWKAGLEQAKALYLNPPRIGYWGPRPYVQPPWSATTGEQAGFGVNLLGRAVALGEPWFAHAMLWSCDSYALRPTANREPNGDPFTYALHPKAQTMGQRPDLGFGLEDRIGWPGQNQIAWIEGYVPSDDQHRDARSLHATIALTGDPGLRAIVVDHLELAKSDINIIFGLTGATRALGRTMLDYCGAYWLGFADAKELIYRQLDAVGMELARHPGETFLLGALEEAKYGWRVKPDGSLAEWNDPNSSPIIGWQPWQQSIAATQGLDQAWRMLEEPRAREWSLRAARQVVELAFYQLNGRWLHVYSIAWNNGQKPKASDYDGGINTAIYTESAADYWDLASCGLIAAEEPDTALGRKAQEILRAYGAPRGWVESQWRSVR